MIYRLFYKSVCVFLCFICLGSAYAADTLEQPSSQEPQKAVSSADSQKAPSIELVEQPPSQESREATSSVAESKAPSIQVPESTHDFGEVPEGEIISHDFKVKNVGEGVLKIEQVRPGWGCAVARFDREIPPGGEGTVSLNVNLKNYRGKVQKSANILSNDPVRKKIKITLKGKVRPFIRVEPGRVSFRGFPETLDEKVIEINTNSESFRVLGVETKLKDKIDYQLETVEEGKKYRLKVKNLVQREGQYRGNITIKTDHPKKDKVVIRVAAYLEGEIFVKPRVISVGKFNPQKPVRTGKVVVVNNLGNPFQITKKTYDEKLLDVVESPLPDPKKKGFVLEITPKFDNATQKNRKSTSLTFQTDLSNKEHKVRIHLIHRK